MLPVRLCHTQAMEPYGQYCPIVRAAEVLGDRWTPLIIRELILDTHQPPFVDTVRAAAQRPPETPHARSA